MNIPDVAIFRYAKVICVVLQSPKDGLLKLVTAGEKLKISKIYQDFAATVQARKKDDPKSSLANTGIYRQIASLNSS